MKKLAPVFALIAALNAPWIMEWTDSNCAAVGKRFAYIAMAKNDMSPQSKAMTAGMFLGMYGPFVEAKIRASNPDLPTPIACNLFYWKVLSMNPEDFAGERQ